MTSGIPLGIYYLVASKNNEGLVAFRAAIDGRTDSEVAVALTTRQRPVSQPVVNRWRRGDRTPDSDGRDRIEDVYGIGRRLWGIDLPAPEAVSDDGPSAGSAA